MKQIEIYTDGACSGNPGIGGWAAVLLYKEHKKEIFGYCKDTTNNRMELFSIIQSLKSLKEKCIVNLYSDSAYAIDAFNKNYLQNWQKNNWKTSIKEDVKNIDLWKALLMETNKHQINFIKVKGHSDYIYNNRCDELAKNQIDICKENN